MDFTKQKTALLEKCQEVEPALAIRGRNLSSMYRSLLDRWGISPYRWTQLLNGKAQLSFPEAIKISEFLDCHPKELLDE